MSAVCGKPSCEIMATSSGANITPPKLEPLKAWPIAFGLSLSNHGTIIALIAAPLVSAQPLPEKIAAANRWEGEAEIDQLTIPNAGSEAPRIVDRARPSLRCTSGR